MMDRALVLAALGLAGVTTLAVRRQLRCRRGKHVCAMLSGAAGAALNRPVVRTVVLTGGPCAGKTSAEKRLTKDLNALGWGVLFCPEVPTILIKGGAAYPGVQAGERLIEFERHLLRLQLQMEESFRGMASISDKKTVVICDRGIMDAKAYLPEEQWARVLDVLGMDEPSILARYDVIAHLVTAANGAEAFYTTANNDARTETPQEACAIDARLQQCWAAHPHRIVGENYGGDFAAKLDQVSRDVLGALQQLS